MALIRPFGRDRTGVCEENEAVVVEEELASLSFLIELSRNNDII